MYIKLGFKDGNLTHLIEFLAQYNLPKHHYHSSTQKDQPPQNINIYNKYSPNLYQK